MDPNRNTDTEVVAVPLGQRLKQIVCGGGRTSWLRYCRGCVRVRVRGCGTEMAKDTVTDTNAEMNDHGHASMDTGTDMEATMDTNTNTAMDTDTDIIHPDIIFI